MKKKKNKKQKEHDSPSLESISHMYIQYVESQILKVISPTRCPKLISQVHTCPLD